MSKQYLTAHTIDNAHESSIYALGITADYTLTGSGSSAIKLHSTKDAAHPLVHTFIDAHKLGCHHIAASKTGKRAISAGFEGSLKIWDLENLEANGEISDANKGGQVWAIALSADGSRCLTGSHNGRVRIWDLDKEPFLQLRDYETKNIFTLCVDLSADAKLAASGHENGGVYIFNNETGRMLHSLTGLMKPVRSISFSPSSKLLAVCGDFQVIAVYDVHSGEQVFNFTGHTSWVFSIGWSETGQFLVTSSFDGKTKIWSMDTRTCVTTLGESNQPIFCASFLPKIGSGENLVTIGTAITYYREASGAGTG
ncbi:superkiller [Orbilia oligospora]|uniref:Superkiller n=1 Tax=Orbilia oligospora TaxID=2813651 RepID=A0A7C8UGI3_ORBOL|nr:superkiller [Orbilia oligospora]KAF3201473.1 superkiller [Orbilia oligospora]KAF3204398.1 superkiller [Orbilia oligospora]KAF3214300.1 superkiller [Orbilia oligospora]